MKKWNDLSMRERAAFIKVGVSNGLHNINDIHNAYNIYADGGLIDSPEEGKSKLEILHPEIYKSQQERAKAAKERRRVINEYYKEENNRNIRRQENIDRDKNLVMSSLDTIEDSNAKLAKGYVEAGNRQQQNTMNT